MIKGSAWKVSAKEMSECIYRLQVDGIKNTRDMNKVEKALDTWNFVGDGFNSKSDSHIFFFHRKFESSDKFVAWGKEFQEFPLVELDKNGQIKSYVKIGLRTNKRSPARIISTGKRKCGKCGQVGHNSRTCENVFSAEKAVQIFKKSDTLKVASNNAKGTYKCGFCGELGHNKRTCPNK